MNDFIRISHRRTIGLAMTLCALIYSPGAFSQDKFPNRPITIVVGGVAGSVGDIAARVVGRKLGEQLNQPVIIDNRPGAGGLVSMQVVARSKPDGYTLGVGSASSTVVAPAIRKSWPVDLLRDFTPVSLIANSTLVILAARDSQVNTVADLVAAARSRPGTITYGDAAALYRLTMELLGLLADVKFTSIPYKGTPPATIDLVNGLLTVLPDSLGSATPALQTGRVKPLAVMSAQRSPRLPEVPTMVELGYKDFIFGGTISLLAPAGTPKDIVQLLSVEVAKAVATDEVKQAYATALLEPVSSTPEELAAMQVRELKLFSKIVTDAKIEKE